MKKQGYIEVNKDEVLSKVKMLIDNGGTLIEVINVDDKFMIVYSYLNLN